MRKTTAADLAPAFLASLVLVYGVLRSQYENLPPLSWLTPVPLAALAIAEWVLARRIKGAIAHDPRADPLPSIVIARGAALGKASAIVGAVVAGAAGAMVLRVVGLASYAHTPQHDLIVAACTAVSGVLLTASALVLERSALVPPGPE